MRKDKLDPKREVWIQHAKELSVNDHQRQVEENFENEIKLLLCLFEDHIHAYSSECVDFWV